MATYSAATSADVYGYLVGGAGYPSSYSPGDIIDIAAGSYTLSADVTPADGRLAGVTIKGAGPTRTTIGARIWQIVANGNCTIQDMRIMQDGRSAGSLGYGSFNLADGTFTLDRVWITCHTPNTGNLLTFVANAAACNATMNLCRVYGAFRDCISTKAPGGSVLAAASLLTMTDCVASECGDSVSNDQCVTPHDGFAIHMNGGAVIAKTASHNAIASDEVSECLLSGVNVIVGSVLRVTGTYWTPAGWQSRN